MDQEIRYPDISDILALKAAGRRQRAKLSFAEKLAIVDALKEQVKPLKYAREARKKAALNTARG